MSTTMLLYLGTCKPTRPSLSSITSSLPLTKICSLHTTKPSNVKQHSLKLNNANSSVPDSATDAKQTILTRREAVGLSFSFMFLDVFFQPISTAFAESIPCDFTATPSGLAYCDKVVGAGAQPEKGQLIKAHYTGKLENGKVFDSSYNRGKPLTFRVGVGEVIKGWDQGILGGDGVPPMLAGGKRTLKIPPELGYGIRGAGCRGGTCIIPPNSVLLFDVEFIGKA